MPYIYANSACNELIPIQSSTGRYNNILYDQRFCPKCPNNNEIEEHFLFHCTMFNDIRGVHIKPFFKDVQSIASKYVYSQIELKNVSQYIVKALKRRDLELA